MTEQKPPRNNSTLEFSWDTDSPTRRWMAGLALILVGAIFLIGNLTGFEIHNGWAVFILFPAISNFAQAVDAYRASGGFDRSVTRHAFWGLFFVVLAGSFLLDYSLGLLWPVFLILAGIAFLFGAW